MSIAKRDRTFPLYRAVRDDRGMDWEGFSDDDVALVRERLRGVPKFLLTNLLPVFGEFLPGEGYLGGAHWPDVEGLRLNPPFDRQWFEWVALEQEMQVGVFVRRAHHEQGNPTKPPRYECEVYYGTWRAGDLLAWPEGRLIVEIPDDAPWHADLLVWSEVYDPDFAAEQFPETNARAHHGDVFFVLRALAMLNCSNAGTTEQSYAPSPAIRSQLGSSAPREKVRYHVLRVEVPGARSHGGSGDGGGSGKALHICRGHFAVYTEENPHVSGFVGQMWRRAHVRGDPDKGTTLKDYEEVPTTHA